MPPSYASGWAEGDVLVTQGDDYIHVSRAGTIKDALPPAPVWRVGSGRGPASPPLDRSFIEEGALVMARIDAWYAAELATFGAGDEEREQGEDLLQAVGEAGGELHFAAEVELEPAPNHPNRVGVKIVDLDDGETIFMVSLGDISPLESPSDP